jgi:predicted phosphoribosyltransferase
MFKDRKDAGMRLARALEKYGDDDPLVLSIPNGGVRVGFEVSSHLRADFSILVARKLPFPDNPEAGFGAVAEDGSTVMLREFVPYISKKIIDEIVEAQKREIERRIRVLRGNEHLPEMGERCVFLIDDGIAMGSTMQAAVKLCRKRKPRQLVVATPVAAREVKRRLSWMVDDVVVLEMPHDFRAVAQVYADWYDVQDWEVQDILEAWKNFRKRNDR